MVYHSLPSRDRRVSPWGDFAKGRHDRTLRGHGKMTTPEAEQLAHEATRWREVLTRTVLKRALHVLMQARRRWGFQPLRHCLVPTMLRTTLSSMLHFQPQALAKLHRPVFVRNLKLLTELGKAKRIAREGPRCAMVVACFSMVMPRVSSGSNVVGELATIAEHATRWRETRCAHGHEHFLFRHRQGCLGVELKPSGFSNGSKVVRAPARWSIHAFVNNEGATPDYLTLGVGLAGHSR